MLPQEGRAGQRGGASTLPSQRPPLPRVPAPTGPSCTLPCLAPSGNLSGQCPGTGSVQMKAQWTSGDWALCLQALGQARVSSVPRS